MTLPVNPNAISLSAIQGEFGGSNPISLSEYYAGGSQVAAGTLGYPLGVSTVIPSSGVLRFANFHGATNFVFSQIQKLLASDAASFDYFGYSVALSADGSTAIIGAFAEDTSPNTDNGAAYVFTRSGSTWTQQAKLLASDAASSDNFGYSVALSADGSTAIIGAYLEDTSPNTNNGAAYVFTKSESTWTQQAKLLASDAASSDNFGLSVALSADGSTAIIGAYLEDTSPNANNGAAYVFTRSGSTWSQQSKLLASDAQSNDNFGLSVALSADGSTAIIGAFAEDTSPNTDNGAAYVFTRSESTWSQQAKLLASDAASSDGFGYSVALSADGSIAIIGAYAEDTSPNTNNGAAYVFTRSGSTWSQQSKLLASDAASFDNFGLSVALSADGSIAIIGAYAEDTFPNTNNGAAYVFTKSESTWSQQQKLVASDAASSDIFGFSVALSADGSKAIIGAYLEVTSPNTNNGAAYVFERPYQQWSATQLAIFAFGETSAGIKTSNRNLVNALGVVSADEATVGTGRSWLAAAGYGGDKAIFGFGFTAGDVVSNFSNKVTNTGIVLSSESTLASSKGYVAATGYGVDKAIFGFGYNASNVYVSSTNHVDNNGNMSSDINLIRTIRGLSAAARFGSNRAMFLSGRNTNFIPLQTYNIVNDSGLIGADLTFSGDGTAGHAGAAYGGNEAIFGFGSNAFGVGNGVRYITNTGVVGSVQSTIGLARDGLSCTNYGGDKAIFGFGFSVARVNITNLVSNTGQVAADVSTLASAKNENAAAGYGF